MNGYKALLASGIYIDDYSMNGPSEVLSKCRRLKREQGLDLVIIDYLQLMTSKVNGKAAESRQVEVSDMSRKMKIYAKELDCPIILLSQMSRGVEQRPDHTPLLSDLRESGSIEQDADVVVFLNNPHKYNQALPENEVILDVKRTETVLSAKSSSTGTALRPRSKKWWIKTQTPPNTPIKRTRRTTKTRWRTSSPYLKWPKSCTKLRQTKTICL